MQRKTTRRSVLTLTGGALAALAGCGGSGAEEGTATETDDGLGEETGTDEMGGMETETEGMMNETETEEMATETEM